MTKLKTKNKRKAKHRTALLKRLEEQNFIIKIEVQEAIPFDFEDEMSLWIDQMKLPENEITFREEYLNGCWDNSEPKPRHHIKSIIKPAQFEWILGQ